MLQAGIPVVSSFIYLCVLTSCTANNYTSMKIKLNRFVMGESWCNLFTKGYKCDEASFRAKLSKLNKIWDDSCNIV